MLFTLGLTLVNGWHDIGKRKTFIKCNERLNCEHKSECSEYASCGFYRNVIQMYG